MIEIITAHHIHGVKARGVRCAIMPDQRVQTVLSTHFIQAREHEEHVAFEKFHFSGGVGQAVFSKLKIGADLFGESFNRLAVTSRLERNWGDRKTFLGADRVKRLWT